MAALGSRVEVHVHIRIQHIVQSTVYSIQYTVYSVLIQVNLHLNELLSAAAQPQLGAAML